MLQSVQDDKKRTTLRVKPNESTVGRDATLRLSFFSSVDARRAHGRTFVRRKGQEILCHSDPDAEPSTAQTFGREKQPDTDAIPRRFSKINLPAQAQEFSDPCTGERRNTQAETKEIVPDSVAQPDRNSDTISKGIAHVIAQSGTEGGDDRA